MASILEETNTSADIHDQDPQSQEVETETETVEATRTKQTGSFASTENRLRPAAGTVFEGPDKTVANPINRRDQPDSLGQQF